MTSTTAEFYRKKKVGKLDIHWNGGRDEHNPELFHQSYEAIKSINKLLIVAHTEPHTAASCFRMIYLLTREARSLGVESRVVLPDENLLDAAEVTGFSHFYRVFLSEAEALEDLDITDFYPLTLIHTIKTNPDPKAA